MAIDRDTMMQLTGGLDPMDAPVPGESLTTSPDAPAPHERPPEFTDERAALEDIFKRVISEDALDEILDLMRAEVPVEAIVQTMLFEGFRQGKYNPDLMLLLLEPTIYIMLWLAEYAGIDPVLGPEFDDELDVEVEDEDVPGSSDMTDIEVDANTLLSNLPQSLSLPSGQQLSRQSLLQDNTQGE